MSKVVVDITMSLDGYVTAAGADPQHGLGVGGEPLHAWVWRDKGVLDAGTARTGAVIMGRRTFDVIDSPYGWSEEVAYGADRRPAELPPIFVVSHSVPAKIRLTERFTFTASIQDALDQAREAAGEKDVVIMGGGAICRSYLSAGLVDELSLHIAPIILGGGTPLFPVGRLVLERESSLSTPDAEHVAYRVLNEVRT